MNMFSGNGQVNASSVKEAMETIVRYASLINNQPSNVGLTPEVSEDQRDALISRALLTQDGKVALAQAMANPIRRNLDYMGIARRALVVDQLN